jgi:hypothetical protein
VTVWLFRVADPVSRRLRRKKRASAAQLSLTFARGQGALARFWQRRFYDFNGWSLKRRVEKLHYMHMNPLKRKLVDHPKDWPWSSFSFYANPKHGLIPRRPGPLSRNASRKKSNPPPLRNPRRSGHPEKQNRPEGCATRPKCGRNKPPKVDSAIARCYWATTNSMAESLVILEPTSGVCSVTVPLGHCGDGMKVVLASLRPDEASMRSASGRDMPTSHGIT